MKRALPLLLAFACAGPGGHWPPRPAEHPATRRELAVYELSVRAGSREERDAFAALFAARGFNIVDHPPRHLQLEVTLTHEPPSLVATLRSDDFFVDEAVTATLEELVETLAVSQRVADFIRNSGLPQQHPMPESRASRRGRSSYARVLPRGEPFCLAAALDQPQAHKPDAGPRSTCRSRPRGSTVVPSSS